MIKRKILITKKKEENTIAELLQLACSFSCDILIESEKKKFNPKSLLGIMKFELKENVEAVNFADQHKRIVEFIENNQQNLVLIKSNNAV